MFTATLSDATQHSFTTWLAATISSDVAPNTAARRTAGRIVNTSISFAEDKVRYNLQNTHPASTFLGAVRKTFSQVDCDFPELLRRNNAMMKAVRRRASDRRCFAIRQLSSGV